MDLERTVEIFREILNKTNMGAGQVNLDCVCGRRHFAGNNPEDSDNQMEMAEWYAFRRKSLELPDNYIPHEGDSTVVSIRVNGLDYIEECPCKWEERMVKFFANEQELIVRFLGALLAEQQREIPSIDAKLVELSKKLEDKIPYPYVPPKEIKPYGNRPQR